PSFETVLANLVGWSASGLSPALAPYGNIDGYSVDVSFTGSSIYLGGQLCVSYAINDMFSVAAGLRLIYAKNTYEGSLENMTLLTDDNPPGEAPELTSVILGPTFGNKVVDAKRTGSAYIGIVGLNIAPVEGLNIGIRYEHLTKLEMVNETAADSVGLFPDGEKINADMPSMIAVGASYQVMPQLKVETSFSYYLNTAVNWDGKENYLENGNEIGVAIEYSISDALAASVGYLISTSGAKDEYQSDMDYSLNSSTLGLGIKYAINQEMSVSLGFSNTFYKEGQNTYNLSKQKEKYMKTAIVGAIGLEYSF
ncbi:MAG: outer membrane beta-barrel protein, partial [Candidatus Marinimicrobia bacterium]|nr:outer membrane beta-barrel protein [Candidatus Neomarinimicrobiota bacterium]